MKKVSKIIKNFFIFVSHEPGSKSNNGRQRRIKINFDFKSDIVGYSLIKCLPIIS